MYEVSNEKDGRLAMVFAMAISGTIGISVLFSQQSPLNAVFFRCAIGGGGLLCYSFFKGYHKGLKFTSKQLVMLALGGVTLIFNWVFLFTAYKMTSIGIATIIYHFQPFLLLFGGAFFLKERINISNVIWLIMAFIGVVIVVLPGSIESTKETYVLGCISALFAALLYAATTLITKSVSSQLRPEIIASFHMVFGSIVFAALADFNTFPEDVNSWAAVLVLGLFHTTFLYVLLYTAFKKASTASLAIFGFLYPLVAVLADYLVFGNTISVLQMFGGLMIVLAGLLYNYGVDVKKFGKFSF